MRQTAAQQPWIMTPEDPNGIGLAYTFPWTRAVAFPDQRSAIAYVSQLEHAGRGWDVAFAPWGVPFGAGLSS
jgi:hypothetical protein